MNDRTRLIAKVHVAKKQLALDDDTYRDVLERVTGQRSAGNLDMAELVRVIEAFKAKGWGDSSTTNKKSTKPHVRKIWALWFTMKRAKVVTADDWRAALRAFVERLTGVADPEWLTPEQATKVIESLKQWQARAARGEQ